MKLCKNCQRKFPDYARFCPDCGILLENEADAALPAPDDAALTAPVETPEPENENSYTTPEPEPENEPRRDAGFGGEGPRAYDDRAYDDRAYSGYERPYYSAPEAPAEPEPPSGKWAPATLWEYVGIDFLTMVPVVNLVFLFIWACGGAKRAAIRRAAGAKLVVMGISIALSLIIFIVVVVTVGPYIIDFFENELPHYYHYGF